MDQRAAFSIGELAKLTGTQVETVRWYEKVGLLAPALRTAGNYRQYDIGQLKHLTFIRRSRALGFTLDEVRVLLTLANQGDRDCDEVDTIARKHLDTVERKIADLTVLAEELRTIINQCRGGSVSGCKIIEALDGK